MLTYNDLKKGVVFALEGQPYEVLEYEFLRMQQRKPVAKTKIKNLISGKIVERNFHQNESFEEAEIEKDPVKFLYAHRGDFWFSKKDDPANRFSFKEDVIGPVAKFLKPNMEVIAVKFGEQMISIQAPIKVDLIVKEAPPGIKGDTAQGGTKAVTLETGAMVNVPLFVNAGDLVRVNTETGEYVERMEKGK
jgi:elongation factor P